MKCAFFTNYLSIHTGPFFDELSNLGYTILCIESQHVSSDRRRIGDNYKSSHIKTISFDKYISLNTKENTFDFCFFSDFENMKLIRNHTNCSQWFFMSEHFIKKFRIRTFLSFLKIKLGIKIYFKNDSTFALCNSYYAGREYRYIGFEKSKIFKFGYFPNLDLCLQRNNKKDEKRIVWSGRFLKWKHPEHAVFAFEKMYAKDQNYRLIFIGEGPRKRRIAKIVHKKHLDDGVVFKNFLPHEKLMDEMCKANMYIFSSDRNEGWGVVLSEALSCGCIVFASKFAGSTRYLETNGNMFVYNSKKQLISSFISLHELDKTQREEIARNAISTIALEWNYKEAAKRFDILAKSLTSGVSFVPFSSGPLSLHFVSK